MPKDRLLTTRVEEDDLLADAVERYCEMTGATQAAAIRRMMAAAVYDDEQLETIRSLVDPPDPREAPVGRGQPAATA